jgi:hypothetical protein
MEFTSLVKQLCLQVGGQIIIKTILSNFMRHKYKIYQGE